jgi:hypothetical protein
MQRVVCRGSLIRNVMQLRCLRLMREPRPNRVRHLENASETPPRPTGEGNTPEMAIDALPYRPAMFACRLFGSVLI